MNPCRGVTPKGTPCKVRLALGAEWCRWHDPSPTARARHRQASELGGITKAYGALEKSESLRASIGELDLSTAVGLASYLACALHGLGNLPFDTRVAHAIAALINAQRATIELASLEKRIEKLEVLSDEDSSPPPASRVRRTSTA